MRQVAREGGNRKKKVRYWTITKIVQIYLFQAGVGSCYIVIATVNVRSHRLVEYIYKVYIILDNIECVAIVTQHIDRYQLLEDSIFELALVQSQNISKYGPKVNFKISHILKSSMLIDSLSSLKDLM